MRVLNLLRVPCSFSSVGFNIDMPIYLLELFELGFVASQVSYATFFHGLLTLFDSQDRILQPSNYPACEFLVLC